MSRVVNLREFRRPGSRFALYDLPPDVIRVDRLTRWGNPYRIGDQWPFGGGFAGPPMARRDAIAAFARYARERLETEPGWLDPLLDKRLACWCAPEPCHADVLAELLTPVPSLQGDSR